MLYQLAAEGVLILHAGFVVFAVLGGLLAFRWPVTPLLHLPAVAWAVYIESSGGICPLTPIENRFLRAAGESGYSGDFLEHYLFDLLYPSGLTREIQYLLAITVMVINVVVYLMVWHQRKKSRRQGTA